MKFRSLKNWENLHKLDGLAYFAQLSEELLFDYSLDTYKPSAMTTPTLCEEALRLLDEVEDGLIHQNNLKHVIDEFSKNLNNDEVAKSLITSKVETILNPLKREDVTLYEKKTILKIISGELALSDYKKRNEDFLLEAVASAKDKSRIRALTRSYISILLSIGYSESYLYPSVRRFFHWDGSKKTKAEDIQDFFKLIPTEDQEYIAIFRASKEFEEIAESCKEIKLKIARGIDGDYLSAANSKNFNLRESEVYLISDPIEAKDVFSARNKAEASINLISSFSGLFHHKRLPSWDSRALMVNKRTLSSRIADEPVNPMFACKDMRLAPAALALNTFIKNLSFEEFHSFDRFFSAAQLHALALKSGSPENQLLNLWVALETLVPSKFTRDKAKITNTIDSIMPFLGLNYIPVLVDRILKDFMLWDSGLTKRAIEDLAGAADREKMMRLLLVEEHYKERHRLLENLKDFHLLRDRANYLMTVLTSKNQIKKMLKAHEIRVAWQVRRIYRTRNEIVHAGYSPSYTNVLIRNLHDYVDNVITGVCNLASEGGHINSIDQAFKYSDMIYRQYLQELSGDDERINKNNFHKFIKLSAFYD